MGANLSLLEKGFINTERARHERTLNMLDWNWMYQCELFKHIYKDTERDSDVYLHIHTS